MNSEEIEMLYRETAFHEAGHAVVLLDYGRQAHAFIKPRQSYTDINSMGESAGQCGSLPILLLKPYLKLTRSLGRAQDRVFSLAGPLAEVLASSPDYLGGDDLEWFEAILTQFSEGNLDWPRDCTDAVRFRAAREAMKIIRVWQQPLIQIADRLMAELTWSSFCYVPIKSGG